MPVRARLGSVVSQAPSAAADETWGTRHFAGVIGSGPLLSQRSQVRTTEIFGRHGNAEFDFGIELKEPGLSQSGNIGRAIKIDHKDAAAVAFPFREVCGFGFDGVENLVHLLPHRAVPDQSVERFNGELNQHDHAHKRPPGAVESRFLRARHGPQCNTWVGTLIDFTSNRRQAVRAPQSLLARGMPSSPHDKLIGGAVCTELAAAYSIWAQSWPPSIGACGNGGDAG